MKEFFRVLAGTFGFGLSVIMKLGVMVLGLIVIILSVVTKGRG